MKNDSVAVFRNREGELVERYYGNFYSMLPATANPLIAESGLADSTGYLNVDQHTLQHK
jgi:NADPH-dependent 2,4-dienoyl-CoA reductase/sulfur reductase-like enzyme